MYYPTEYEFLFPVSEGDLGRRRTRQSRRLRLAVVADADADAAVGKEGARVRVRLRIRAQIPPRATRFLDPVPMGRVRLQAKVRAKRERLRRKLQRRGGPRIKRQLKRASIMW